MKHLVIVDGMGFLFRAYHAIRSGLTRKDGLPTNALYGFAQMLVKVVDDLQPDECVVALDSKGPNWRHKLYGDYKANRPPPEPAMAAQLPLVEPLVKAFGLPVMRMDGMEADDIIATLVAQHSADKVTIVTSDKDLLQLVDDKVQLLDTLKDKWSGPEQAVEKFGVGPELVLEVQALMGDSSDNIPGVPGVGPKTAAELVQRFGKLEDIYARIGELEKENLRQKLLDFKDQAFLSRNLAKLDNAVALPEVDIGFHPALHRAADYLREELEFTSLAARLERRKGEGGVDKIQEKAAVWRQNAAESGKTLPNAASAAGKVAGEGPQAAGWGEYESVLTTERWQAWLKEAREVGVVAFDTETTSLDPYAARLVGVSLATRAGHACYVPVKERGTRNEERGQGDLFAGGVEEVRGPHGVEGLEVLADLRALLADPAVKKVGHNLKYDWLVVARALGVTPGDTGKALQEMVVNFEDTMLMSACLDGGRWAHGMDDLVARHLGHAMIKYEEVCGKGKTQVTFDAVPLDTATAYAAEDADATWRLWEKFRDPLSVTRNPLEVGQGRGENLPAGDGLRVTGYGPGFVYAEIERALLPVIVAMEARGVMVDVPALKGLSADFAKRMAEFEAQIWKLAGHEFNVQSTQQLAVVLFDEMGLGTEKQKKSRSTAVGVLEDLGGEGEGFASSAILDAGAPTPSPAAVGKVEPTSGQSDMEPAVRGALMAKVVLGYRQLAKLRSTYTETLMEEVSPLTGRVHTTYQQMGAATGRFSSNDPNLQNIPIRTEEGRKIRHAFIPQPGWVMVSADYSQIELRLLAHFSDCAELKKAFNEGLDVHSYTAHLIYGVGMDEVTRDQRRVAKVINFGLVYGMGARSMAGNIGSSVSEAQAWIDAYFKRYQGVREYMDANKKKARELGYVETLCGRRVWLPEIASSNGGLRAGAERAAINAPLQGSNADVIKLAMPQVEERVAGLRGGGVAGVPAARLLMQVHDELVLECAPEVVDAVKAMLPEVMGGVVKLSVPLAVEVGSGGNWEDAH
ncbi:MAG: DNA polymerase I [Proteobacteria bacterium]|nr:DNA polymerase I [Pseudomonadota bacterium]